MHQILCITNSSLVRYVFLRFHLVWQYVYIYIWIMYIFAFPSCISFIHGVSCSLNTLSYQYGNLHYKIKMARIPFYIHNGNPYSCKDGLHIKMNQVTFLSMPAILHRSKHCHLTWCQHRIVLLRECHYADVKSPASRLFTEPFIQAQIKENIKAPRHWPLCGKFTGDRWIPRTNGQ